MLASASAAMTPKGQPHRHILNSCQSSFSTGRVKYGVNQQLKDLQLQESAHRHDWPVTQAKRTLFDKACLAARYALMCILLGRARTCTQPEHLYSRSAQPPPRGCVSDCPSAPLSSMDSASLIYLSGQPCSHVTGDLPIEDDL